MALVSQSLDLELDGLAREWAAEHFNHRPSGCLSHTTKCEASLSILETGVIRLGDLKAAAPEQNEVHYCTEEMLSVVREVRESRPHTALDVLLKRPAFLDIVRSHPSIGFLSLSESEQLFNVFGEVSLIFDGTTLSREAFMQSLWLNKLDYDIGYVRTAASALIHKLLDAFERHPDADLDDPQHIGFLADVMQEMGVRQCFAPKGAPEVEREWRIICGTMGPRPSGAPFGVFDLRRAGLALRMVLLAPSCPAQSADRIYELLARDWPHVTMGKLGA